MYCTVVELAEKTTSKLLVAVLTNGWSPRSNSKGPRINPPPIPSKPDNKPEINEKKENLKIIDWLSHFISVLL